VPVAAEYFEPRQAGSRPAVVLLYGSGGMVGAAPAYRWYARSLADSGVTTIICPYFEASHGRERRNAANTRIWVKAVQDCVTFLGKQPHTDKRRIGILGFSMGGYLGMSAIPHEPRVHAFVDFFGPRPELRASDWAKFPPSLILHGRDDRSVGVSNSRELDRNLTAAKVRHELVLYPAQGHGFREPAAGDAHRRTVEFFVKNLAQPQ
jgi:carboxymethylenebutenolidase